MVCAKAGVAATIASRPSGAAVANRRCFGVERKKAMMVYIPKTGPTGAQTPCAPSESPLTGRKALQPNRYWCRYGYEASCKEWDAG